MQLTTIDNEKVEIEAEMVAEMHRRGKYITEVTLKMEDRHGHKELIRVKETPEQIYQMIREDNRK